MEGLDLIRYVKKGDYVICSNNVKGKVSKVNRKTKIIMVDHSGMIRPIPIGNIERVVDKREIA